MRSVTSLGPSLALARYHLLSGIRNAHAVFLFTVLCALLPIFVSLDPLGQAMWDRTQAMRVAVQVVVAVYLAHLLLVVAASTVVARRGSGPQIVDLTETVPITPFGRYIGHVLGVLGCTFAIHACTLPLLAVAFILSPLQSPVFWWWELVIVALLILSAAGEAWKRQFTGPGGRARTAANIGLFLAMLMLVVASTTRWAPFRDAFFS